MAQIFFFILPNGGLVVEKPYTVKGFKTNPANLERLEAHFWQRVEQGRCYNTFVAVAVSGSHAASTPAPAPLVLVRRGKGTESGEHWQLYPILHAACKSLKRQGVELDIAKIEVELRQLLPWYNPSV